MVGTGTIDQSLISFQALFYCRNSLIATRRDVLELAADISKHDPRPYLAKMIPCL